MLDAATEFGLTREEAWLAFKTSLAAVRAETAMSDCMDEIAGALAREILAKQRRLLRRHYS